MKKQTPPCEGFKIVAMMMVVAEAAVEAAEKLTVLMARSCRCYLASSEGF